MPQISFFADVEDAPLLVNHLNEDPDLAFLVPVDPLVLLSFSAACALPGGSAREQRCWRAVRTVASLGDGWHALWHVPTPQPLASAPGRAVADPWGGWRGDTIVGTDRVLPDVGPGPSHPGMIYLDLWTRHRPYAEGERPTEGVPLSYSSSYWAGPHELLKVSGFSWTGSHYRPAPRVTTLWWSRFKRWLSKTCVKLTDAQTGRQTFYAFPSALGHLKAGIKYEALRWDLDASIRAATPP